MGERPSRSQIALWIAAAVAVVVVGGRYLLRPSSSSPPPAPPVRVQPAAARPSAVLVHVAGAVRRPGVYRLRSGERIDDAVTRAGGATTRADLSAVNLAAKVEDGRQVLVPERAPRPAAAPSEGAAPGASASGGVPPGAPISLTSATVEQLDTLPGVGPATAQKILAYRDEHGGFGSVDDLADVPGIGDKRLAALKDLVRP